MPEAELNLTVDELSLGRMLEALSATGGVSDHVPSVPGIDPAVGLLVIEALHRRGWIEAATTYGANGRLFVVRNLRLTQVGALALKELRVRAGRTTDANGQSVPLDEKRHRRFDLMQRLYDRTDGSLVVGVDVYVLGEELGWNRGATDDVAGFLEAEGLLRYVAMEGLIGITHQGVLEVEQARGHPDRPTEHFPAVVNVVNVENMYSSQIQQGTTASTQNTWIVSEESKETVIKVLEALKADLHDIELDDDDQSELNAELMTIETQLGSSRPKREIIKSSLSCLAAVLTRGAVLSGSAVELAVHLERIHQVLGI